MPESVCAASRPLSTVAKGNNPASIPGVVCLGGETVIKFGQEFVLKSGEPPL